MEIRIRLLASYRRWLPETDSGETGYALQVPTGVCVEDVLGRLPIPASDMYTFLINGRHAGRDQLLYEGDVLSVFPAAGGG